MHAYTPEQVIRQLQYRPAKFHERPTVIEAELSLRVNSSTLIVMDVDKAYMLYQDYPPDANRGFDVPAGIVLVDPESQEERRRIYTDIALIDLPLPDFSMPYNVIIMTCELFCSFHSFFWLAAYSYSLLMQSRVAELALCWIRPPAC